MDFVTIDKTLDGIADGVSVPYGMKHPDLVQVWRYSEAAANLHQQLHNLPELRPKWATVHKVTGKPVFNDAVANEGMEMLEHMAGWFKKQDKAYSGDVHLFRSTGRDRDPEARPPFSQIPDGKYKRGTRSRALEIGFDRSELIRFLNDSRVGIEHRIRGGEASEPGVRPLAQRRHQEQEIARIIPGVPSKTAMAEPQVEKRPTPKLMLPDKSDTWAKAIEATYEIIMQETGRTPSGAEVWLRMNDKHPANYPIKVTKDHGLAAIVMPGEKLLTRDGFLKRWGRYTSSK